MRGNWEDQKNKTPAYISKELSALKKPPKWFYSHENSVSFQAFSAYHLIVPRCNDVGEMVDDQVSQQREDELKYLLDIIKCLRYLARREIPLQGLDNNDNLTQILYLLRTKVNNLTKHIQDKSR